MDRASGGGFRISGNLPETRTRDRFNMDKVFNLYLIGRRRQLMQLLRSQPNQIDAKDSEGDTLLHKVAFDGDVKFAEKLVQIGANVDEVNYQGRTPLHVAALQDQPPMVDWLIKKGATIEKKDRRGATPLCLASGSGAFLAAEALLNAGASLDLNSAVALKRKEELQQVFETGVQPSQAIFPDRLLYEAAFHQQREIVEILLRNGADPNLQMQGTSPLHAAVSSTRSEPQIVQLLLQAGANPKVRDKTTNQTPLEQALRLSVSTTIIDMLRKHGG